MRLLPYFVDLAGDTDPAGRRVDAIDLFRKALEDNDADVQWQALAQLRLLELPATKSILEAYVLRASEGSLRDVALDILATLPGDAP